MVSVQIPLKISLREEISFDSFVTGKPETAILLNQFQSALRQSSGGAFYLQGPQSVGKSHLLQASCRYKTDLKQSSVYLPLKDTSLPLIADSLKGLEEIDLVCIDDIDCKIDQIEWQISLANLLVKSQTAGHIVVLSGQSDYLQWPVAFPELNSALVGVLTIPIPLLSVDEDVVDALQRHANKIGFDLPLEVGNYLVKTFSNQLAELMAVLAMLEQATLVEKRRLTLPFVKQFLKREK